MSPAQSPESVIIGINAFGHDGGACVVRASTGEVLFASAEERMSNIKHDWHLPIGTILSCLRLIEKEKYSLKNIAVNFRAEEFITGTLASEIRKIVSNDKRAQQLIQKIVEIYTFGDYYDQEGYSFSKIAIEESLKTLQCTPDESRRVLKRVSWYYNWAVKYKNLAQNLVTLFPDIPVEFYNHHLAHAASAYLNSGFKDATVVVIDGQGESDTVSIYDAGAKGITPVSKTQWPYSLGIFYLVATEYLGFGLGDEYKVMGMSAYGQPRYYDIIRQMMYVTENAELRFTETPYWEAHDIPNSGHYFYRFTDEFLKVVQRPDKKVFLQQHFDFAASIQKVTEEVGVEIVTRAVRMTGKRSVAIAGGVGLNGLMNEQIRQSGACDDIFIYPAAADDGTSIGAAQYSAFKKNKFQPKKIYSCYYGYTPQEDEIHTALLKKGVRFQKTNAIHHKIAEALANNKIVARYYGAAEFGPRALGHRSIMANPQTASMKDTLNLRVKHREEFRPFAPACLREHMAEYFDIDVDSPFMLLICQAKEKARKEAPAVVHEDGTARVQTVHPEYNRDFYKTISAFKNITGLPIIINTSFNVNGEAIVDTPEDALESFGFMDIDYLAIGDYWVSKEENRSTFPELGHKEYLEIRTKRFQGSVVHPLKYNDINKFNNAFNYNEEGTANVNTTATGDHTQLLNQAIYFINNNKDEEALPLLEKILLSSPGEIGALLGRAVIRARKGVFAGALVDVEAALVISPENEIARNLYSQIKPRIPAHTPGVHHQPVSASNPLDKKFYGETIVNVSTLAQFASDNDTWRSILAFHSDLASDEYVEYVDAYYRECMRRFGKSWFYLDIVNVLYASATLIQPKNYLEIGVRRGRSVCTVAHGCPDVNIYAFDMWMSNYADMENPGPEFVQSELLRHGHKGQLHFINGDSHQTVPKFFAENPSLRFDLITVDGDHTEEGALDDLRNVIPHLAVGGIIVFDDISHPQHLYLLNVWRHILERYPYLSGYEYTEAGYGIAFAIRTK